MAVQTQIRLLGQLTPISIRKSFFNDCVDVWVGDRIWTFYKSATIKEIQEVLEEGLRHER